MKENTTVLIPFAEVPGRGGMLCEERREAVRGGGGPPASYVLLLCLYSFASAIKQRTKSLNRSKSVDLDKHHGLVLEACRI